MPSLFNKKKDSHDESSSHHHMSNAMSKINILRHSSRSPSPDTTTRPPIKQGIKKSATTSATTTSKPIAKQSTTVSPTPKQTVKKSSTSDSNNSHATTTKVSSTKIPEPSSIDNHPAKVPLPSPKPSSSAIPTTQSTKNHSGFLSRLKNHSSTTLDTNKKENGHKHSLFSKHSASASSTPPRSTPQQGIRRSSTTPVNKSKPLHSTNNNNNNNNTRKNISSEDSTQMARSSSTTTTSTPRLGLPSVNEFKQKKSTKLEYNPYGLKNHTPFVDPRQFNPALSVDPIDDQSNILPYPVEDPNDHLPEELREDHQNLFEDFDIPPSDRKIGDGASASVLKIFKKDKIKEVYALKKFILFKNEKPKDFYERATKEYVITKNLYNGLHIVKCEALVRIPNHKDLTRGWGFVLELCKCDLFDLIQRPGWKFVPTNEKFCLFKQLAFGIKFMHECDIVHRDIKPENILLNGKGVLKITDFGVADYGHTIAGDFTSSVKQSDAVVGSPPYAPPEVSQLSGTQHSQRTAYDPFKMDIWALGMVLFCICLQGVPFSDCTRQIAQYRDYESAYQKYMSSNPKFIKNQDFKKGPGMEYKFAKSFPDTNVSRVAWRLCDPNASTRYTLVDLFNDPWFQQLEMCVNENDYECNFYHHEDAGDFKGKVSYGCTDEIVHSHKNSSTSFNRYNSMPTMVPAATMNMVNYSPNMKPKMATYSSSSSFASLSINPSAHSISKHTTPSSPATAPALSEGGSDSEQPIASKKSMLDFLDTKDISNLPTHDQLVKEKDRLRSNSIGNKSRTPTIPPPQQQQSENSTTNSSSSSSTNGNLKLEKLTDGEGNELTEVDAINELETTLSTLPELTEEDSVDNTVNGGVDKDKSSVSNSNSSTVPEQISPPSPTDDRLSLPRSKNSSTSVLEPVSDSGLSTPGLSRRGSVSTLNTLCTQDGVKIIKLPVEKSVPIETIKKSASCKLKAHKHLDVSSYGR
ncbi:nucleotide binding protein [[Candida] boidinii]|nr:nucleotide binding protein [[Candida] boidinii]OWB60993.1 nucleotide binding protein [[Candida] boidinii]